VPAHPAVSLRSPGGALTPQWSPDRVRPTVPPEELDGRVAVVRSRLAADHLDGILISVPENIHYLTGLDHWGFFACHLLVVPRDGELVLTCRAMVGTTVGNQVGNAPFLGHSDTEDITDYAVRAMARVGIRGGRIAMEMHSLFLTPRIADAIREKTPDVAWREVAAAAGLADYHRHHRGYIVSIGFPPSWTGGSKVVGLAPGSGLELKLGMTFHAHSWFTNAEVVDYFICPRSSPG